MASLPAAMGTGSVTGRILWLPSLLCPPAPVVAGQEGSRSEATSACWEVLPRGCCELDNGARGQAAALPAPGSTGISRRNAEQPESCSLSKLSKWEGARGKNPGGFLGFLPGHSVLAKVSLRRMIRCFLARRSDVLRSAHRCPQPGRYVLGAAFPWGCINLQLRGDKSQWCLGSPGLGCCHPALRGCCCVNVNLPWSVGRLLLTRVTSLCLGTRAVLQKGSEMMLMQRERCYPPGCHPLGLLATCPWCCSCRGQAGGG